jgi:hypothetical protein
MWHLLFLWTSCCCEFHHRGKSNFWLKIMLNPFFGENCQNNAKVPKKFIPARTKILSYWYYVVMFPSSDFKLPRSTCKVWHPNDEIVDRPQNGKPWIPGFSTYPLRRWPKYITCMHARTSFFNRPAPNYWPIRFSDRKGTARDRAEITFG